MAKDMKTGVGFIIPAAGVVGFFTSLFLGEHLISIIVAVLGILAWFAYMLVMESHVPREMGNMIILFGVLLSFTDSRHHTNRSSLCNLVRRWHR